MKCVYLSVRQWVDRKWADVSGWRVLLFPLFALAFASIPVRERGNTTQSAAFWLTVTLGVAWVGFTFWRWWIYLKRISFQAGKDYEKRGRYRLPSDYADSEDALMAERRKPTGPRKKV